jgi:hypothetical protein
MGARRIGRKVLGEREAVELLGEWEESEERLSEFCARRGVNWSSLAAYRTMLRRRDAGPRLVEIGAPARRVPYRIVFGNGHALELGDGFDDDVVRRVSAIVASC